MSEPDPVPAAPPPATGQRVPVKLRDGRIGTVPLESFESARRKGAVPITPQAYQEHRDNEEFGDTSGTAIAAGAGVLRGLTAGLSDPALIGAGNLISPETREEFRTTLAKTKAASPWVSAGSEIAGALAPIVLSGGAAAPAEGALVGADLARAGAAGVEAADAAKALASAKEVSAAARGALSASEVPLRVAAAPSFGIGEVGNLVEHGIQKIVGKQANSLIGKIAQGAAAQAGRGAAEGALYGAGNEFSEASLGDHDLNAEKLLSAMGHGALFGAGAGAVLGAGGQLGKAVIGHVAPRLEKQAGEQAFRAINPRKAFVTAAERIEGGSAGVGQELLDRKLVKMGDTAEHIAERIPEARTAVGEELGKFGELADKAGAEGPSVKAVFKRLAPLEGKLGTLPSMNAGAIGKIEGLKNDLTLLANANKDARLTFTQAREVRARIDDAIKWNTNPLMPVNEVTVALKDMRGALEKEIESGLDTAAKSFGTKGLDEYRAAKLSYARLTVADHAAQDAVQRMGANRVLSPSDYGAGAVGAVLGGGGEHAAHGLLAGALGGPVAGLATALAHHVIRERGNSTAAVLLDKVAALGAIRRANEVVDKEITRGVDGIFGGKGRARIKIPTFAGEDEFADQRSAIAHAASNPDAHEARINGAVQPLLEHAPKTSGAFQKSALRATIFLGQNLPGAHPTASITPQLNSYAPTDYEKVQYSRQWTAVHDPPALLARVQAGTITKQEVDALKATKPLLYADMSQKIEAKLAARTKRMPYSQELAIATFLGKPAGPTARREFVDAMQATFAPAGGSGPTNAGGAPHSPRRPLDVTGSIGLSGAKPIGS